MAGRLKLVASIFAVLVLAAGVANAQSVISAKSGVLHYIEGEVMIDGATVEMKTSIFPDMKQGQVLETGEGRAEILLTPGVFLRISENSSFRLVSNRLTDTRVEALSGSILLEHGEISKETQVTLIYKERSINFVKSGLYRLDADNGTFRVYQGEARINESGQSVTAKQAREISLDAPVLLANKFENKTGDEFYRWASRRASYLALANISGAKALSDSGMRLTSGTWYWNPWFGMYTYVPFGNYFSPFGYQFFNPGRVLQFYQPGYYYGGGGGGSTASAGNTGRYEAGGGYSIPSRAGASSMGSSPMSSGDFSGRVSGMSSGAPVSSGATRGGGDGGGGASAPSSPSGGRGR
jgi:hypothetical protein